MGGTGAKKMLETLDRYCNILFSAEDGRTYMYHSETRDIMLWLYDIAASHKGKIRRISVTVGRRSTGTLETLLHFRRGGR